MNTSLFKCFSFFDEADASLFKGDDQLAGEAFRNNAQILKCIAQLFFPDGVLGLDVGDDLSSNLSILVCHGSSVDFLCGGLKD